MVSPAKNGLDGQNIRNRRANAPASSGTVIGALIALTCTFSAGFNLCFFLMTFRGGHHVSHLPTMEDFVSEGLSGAGLLRSDPRSGDVEKPVATMEAAEALESGGGGRKDRDSDAPLLTCSEYGGPSDETAAEMVYWNDIPSDARFVSPFKKEGERKFMTFEPDVGGWNNIRMAMETVVALAHAMGRTLVMPPKKQLYLLDLEGGEGGKHDNSLHFADFFDLDALSEEHSGLEIMSMEDFLKEQALTGQLKDKATGRPSFPPGNRTNWDGLERNHATDVVEQWLRTVAATPDWNDETCMAAFPSHPGNTDYLKKEFNEIMEGGLPSVAEMSEKPLPVDASTKDRMKESSLGRGLCIYDEEMQDAHLVHFRVDIKEGIRLLVHFYAFLFFEDWRHDLHMKRLVRDHLRYLDEIQCAAARVVEAVRDRARKRNPKRNPRGVFDTMHIRRGDFQYRETRLDAPLLYNLSKAEIPEGTTLYIATDERDRSFFKPFLEHYDVVFLGDLQHLFKGLSKNYYGMLDQLVASRGRTFFGTWFSTFTGYINRMRGYHADKRKARGHAIGRIQSYYFFPKHKKVVMKNYAPVHKQFWTREFPAAWRDIDRGAAEGKEVAAAASY